MSSNFISREDAENDLLAAATFIAERIKSNDGHAAAMKSIVPMYLAKGNVDLAAELANSVDDPYSRDRLLTLVAEKCAEIDDDEYAMQLADAIEDQGIQAQTLERIGLIQAAKGDAEKAAGVADAMSHPDFVYAAIAVKQEASGDEVAAAATLEQIDFATAEVSALQQMASAALERNETEKSIRWLEQALEAAADIEHDEEKIRAFCEIGNLFIEGKRNDKAVETFDTARGFAESLENVHRDFFLATCALGFLHAGSLELADRTLDIVTDKTHMSSALLGFARDSWTKDAKEDAVETLEEAYEIVRSQREAETRDSRSRNALLSSIATQFAGFGKTERGIEIALENPNPDEQTAALSQIAQILTIQREDDLARDAINEIPEDGDQLTALVGMADAKLKLGETADSIVLLEEAATMADSIQQLAARSQVLNAITARFADQGHPERARQLALENLSLISGIRDEGSQATGIASISEVLDSANLKIEDAEKQILQNLVRTWEWK